MRPYVRCGRQTQALGSGLQGIDLARDDPCKGSPSRREEEDENGDKCNASFLGRLVIDDDIAHGVLTGGESAEEGYNELADTHADGTPEEKRATTKFVDGPETRKGGDDVDDGGDDLNREWVLDTGVLEVLGSVIEDEVDARQLLQGLKTHTSKLALEHGPTEAVEVAGLANAKLKFMVRLDLFQFCQNGRVVSRESSQPAERTSGFQLVSLLDQVSRGLREKRQAGDENESPGELDGDRDSIASGVVAVLRSVVYDIGQKQPDGNGKLICTHDGTSNPFRCRFTLV